MSPRSPQSSLPPPLCRGSPSAINIHHVDSHALEWKRLCGGCGGGGCGGCGADEMLQWCVSPYHCTGAPNHGGRTPGSQTGPQRPDGRRPKIDAFLHQKSARQTVMSLATSSYRIRSPPARRKTCEYSKRLRGLT